MKQFAKTMKFSAAETLALNSVPQTILPAPGAGKALVVTGAFFILEAGTAFGGIAAGENLEFKYTDNSGVTIAVCETANFLDQTTLETRQVFPNNGTVAVMEIDGAPDIINEPVILQLNTGDITGGGTRELQVTIFFYIVNSIV